MEVWRCVSFMCKMEDMYKPVSFMCKMKCGGVEVCEMEVFGLVLCRSPCMALV